MTSSWDVSYTGPARAPWDIGRPQPAFVRLADGGKLSGRVLDVGCGTGEQTLLAASRGAEATGIDIAGPAIERARAKAAERGARAQFEVGDALDLRRLGTTFDTLVDSGVFHAFSFPRRDRASLAVRDTAHLILASVVSGR